MTRGCPSTSFVAESLNFVCRLPVISPPSKPFVSQMDHHETSTDEWDVDYFEVSFAIGPNAHRPKVVELPVVGSEWSTSHEER